MAISRKRKEQLVAQYTDWLNRSQALVLVEYAGLKMKEIDELRGKLREAGGEFHIIKNKLGKVAVETSGFSLPEKFLDGSTAAIFAFKDAPAIVKIVSEFSRNSEFVKIKGGYLDKNPLSAADIQAFAELPPLPILRAQLLGVIAKPASILARTLLEPARQVVTVFKAFTEKDVSTATT